MSSIVIEDLDEDQVLDDAAMRAVFGGRATLISNARSMKFAHRISLTESQLIPGMLIVDDLRAGIDL